jgi:ArsR family metal-binding transcriptional regulator
MLLENFELDIFRSKCDSSVQSVQCFAHLKNDVSKVLPYLNSTLGGFSYTKDPPSVTFKAHGKLITIHSNKIAVNALKSQEEAEKILLWLQREINETWENRDDITPSYDSSESPKLIEVLKMLPKTNCGECQEPTCMVFAARVTEGIKSPSDCPPISKADKTKLETYLSQFRFED